MAAVRKLRILDADPSGRVDVLLLRLGELVGRRLETKLSEVTGADISLWDGKGGLEETLTRFCSQHGLVGATLPQTKAGRVEVDVLSLARHAGFIRGRRQFKTVKGGRK